MQIIIEEAVRWVGYATLRVVSLGRYRGGTEDDRFAEGAVGFFVVVGIAYIAYAVIT